MLIKGMDFPEELLRAQSTGELVVFCGAGVSNPPPSALPLFADLAAIIGHGSGLKKDPSDPADRYFGSLKKARHPGIRALFARGAAGGEGFGTAHTKPLARPVDRQRLLPPPCSDALAFAGGGFKVGRIRRSGRIGFSDALAFAGGGSKSDGSGGADGSDSLTR